MTPVLIVFIIFTSLAAIIIAPMYFRSLERQRMQETIRAAIEKGQPLPENITQVVAQNARMPLPPAPSRDLRTGLIWLGVAVGLASMGVAIGYSEDSDALLPLLGISAFPAFIGVAFIVMWAIARDKK